MKEKNGKRSSIGLIFEKLFEIESEVLSNEILEIFSKSVFFSRILSLISATEKRIQNYR